MTWWSSPGWLAYEAAGGYPSRVEELAASTWQTRVIDLSLSEAELWRGVRRSYKSLIHRAEERYLFEIGGAITRCQRLHYREAGRVTRPQSTWDMMAKWAANNYGLAVIAFNEKTPSWRDVGFAYFLRCHDWAYYASAASLEPNVNHALIWHGINYLKARNVRWLEMGWQGHAQDEKGRNIEHFRRGFGGFDMAAKDAPKLAFA